MSAVDEICVCCGRPPSECTGDGMPRPRFGSKPDYAQLLAVYERAKAYVFRSHRFEPGNSYQAALKQAVEACGPVDDRTLGPLALDDICDDPRSGPELIAALVALQEARDLTPPTPCATIETDNSNSPNADTRAP